MAAPPPVRNMIPHEYNDSYDLFFTLTNPAQIRSHMSNLNLIVKLARKADYVLQHANPFQHINEQHDAKQWALDRLSEIKQRLALAIVCKKDYYESTSMGKIAKFFLRIFCLWNNGTTPCIQKAEEFLFRYDSRYPVQKIGGRGRYQQILFWSDSRFRIQQHFNLQNFYNYNPPHAIEVELGQNEDMPRFMVAAK